MGLMDRLNKMFPGKPLSYFAKQEGTQFHRASCDLCGAEFDWLQTMVAYPLPLSQIPSKPNRDKIDVGGWCLKCHRFVCPKEADFVVFSLNGEDWWLPGCRACQVPLGGKQHYDDPKLRRQA